jgi:hypothetical protein
MPKCPDLIQPVLCALRYKLYHMHTQKLSNVHNMEGTEAYNWWSKVSQVAGTLCSTAAADSHRQHTG